MTSNNLGQINERLAKLEEAVFGMGTKSGKKKYGTGRRIDKKTFSLNERAFIRRFAADKSGPRKFALVLAYLAKGDVSKEIERKVIESLWKKMSGKQLLGDFNGYYANEAKNQGLVDSKKRGYYNLTDEWERVLDS